MATIVQTPMVDNNVNMSIIITGVEEITIQPRMKRREEEINKLFDGSKRKLSSLDSQRILSVFDDSLRKLEIVTLLPYIVENISRYSIMLGSDLCDSLNDYDKLQAAYTSALSDVRKCRPNSGVKKEEKEEDNDSYRSQTLAANGISENLFDKEENNNNEEILIPSQSLENLLHKAQNNVDMLGKLVSDSVKTILRLFKQNPSALNSMKFNETKERTTESNTMISEMKEFREQLFCRLVTSPSEEIEKHKLTAQVMQREKKAQTLINKLAVELKTTIKAKEEMIHGKNEVIRELKANMQEIEQETDLRNRKVVSEAQKIAISDVKNSDGKKSKLQQEIIELKQKSQSLISNHKDNETSLRKRKYKIETEVENWIQKYDNDMNEKQNELDELADIHDNEKHQLNDLEEHFKELEKHYMVIMEERRVTREKQEALEQKLRVMVKGATLIQAIWRAYVCRKNLKAKQKKAKKGKGKGKGVKGGKGGKKKK